MTSWSDRGNRARTASTADERELLEAARRGDGDAYGQLVHPTAACLKAIERRPERVLPVDYAPDPHDGPGECQHGSAPC